MVTPACASQDGQVLTVLLVYQSVYHPHQVVTSPHPHLLYYHQYQGFPRQHRRQGDQQVVHLDSILLVVCVRIVQRGRSNKSPASYHANSVRKDHTKTKKDRQNVNHVELGASQAQQAKKRVSSVNPGCSPTQWAAKVVKSARQLCHILIMIDQHVWVYVKLRDQLVKMEVHVKM